MDQDGNGYHTVKIGSQIWTVENLKVTHYNNGDLIPNITDSLSWSKANTGAMCWYDNNKAKYDSVYGALYNFYTISDARGIAPAGWHVPTDREMDILAIYLGNGLVAGGAMKETGTKHWNAPNTGATNSSGFTALPGGARADNAYGGHGHHGHFWDISTHAAFWTSTISPTPHSAFFYYLENDNTLFNSGLDWLKNAGLSIRLVHN